jgi:hypothetical protein
MKGVCLALFVGFLGVLATGSAILCQVSGQAESANAKLVNTLRVLNMQEYGYRNEAGRFASREELLTFLRTKGMLSRSPMIDLENPKPYDLAVTTSQDGMHYQIALKMTYDENDKSTSCRTAAFSDDAGVIFLGTPLGCEQPTQ